MSRRSRSDGVPTSPAVSAPGPLVAVENHDRMARDVTVEVRRDGAPVAVERASLPRGGATSWHDVVDAPGTYSVAVTLRYGSARTTDWTVETPRSARFDVVLSPEGIELRSRPE